MSAGAASARSSGSRARSAQPRARADQPRAQVRTTQHSRLAAPADATSPAALRPPHGVVRRLLVGATALGVSGAVVLLVFTLLGVIPVRAYVLQKHELDAGKARLAMLNERNAALRERVRVLNTDEEMQRLALDQFGMVRPGQKLTVIPGLRTEGSVLDANRTDPIENPAPSATASPKVSRVRAVLDALQFWR